MKKGFLKVLLLGILSLILVSCGGESTSECSCIPVEAELTLLVQGGQRDTSSSDVSVPISGANITLTKALLNLNKVIMTREGAPSDESSSHNPYLLDVLQSDPEVPESTEIFPGTGKMVSLQFWIDDLDDRDQDGIVDGDQQPVNVAMSESTLTGKSILIQGSIEVEGEAPVSFTFTTDLTERVRIPFINTLSIDFGGVVPLLLILDFAEVFNQIDTDPSKTAAQELRDASLTSGGSLDPKTANGGEAIAQAIEGGINQAITLYLDENSNDVPEQNELIGDESLITIEAVSD